MISAMRWVLAALLVLGPMTQLAMAANEIPEIPDRSLVSKGGVLYPYTGDSSQGRFQTPPNYKEFLPMGALLGVLPDDCIEVSKGTVGLYYQCDHGLALIAEDYNGGTAYRVIETP